MSREIDSILKGEREVVEWLYGARLAVPSMQQLARYVLARTGELDERDRPTEFDFFRRASRALAEKAAVEMVDAPPLPAEPCDGGHAGDACHDPECWQRNAPTPVEGVPVKLKHETAESIHQIQSCINCGFSHDTSLCCWCRLQQCTCEPEAA